MLALDIARALRQKAILLAPTVSVGPDIHATDDMRMERYSVIVTGRTAEICPFSLDAASRFIELAGERDARKALQDWHDRHEETQ